MRVEQLIGHDPDGDIRVTLTYNQLQLLILQSRYELADEDYREFSEVRDAMEGYKHDEYR